MIAKVLQVRWIVNVVGQMAVIRRGIASRLRRPSAGKRPPTLSSPLRSRIRRAIDPRPPLHVLHIGKTAGTALKHSLLEQRGVSCCRLLLHGHDVTLGDLPEGERFLFVVRDPISRFVSAFNSRMRCGRPRYYYPWTEGERAAYARFQKADELAAALSASDEQRRRDAEEAMRSIGHLNTSYWYWFKDETTFRARLEDVFFIGFQEHLNDDFEVLKRKLALPSETHLPTDDIAAYRAAGDVDVTLGDLGRTNLEHWYRGDRRFVQLCRELAPLTNRLEHAKVEPGRRRRPVAPAAPRTEPGAAARTRSPAGVLGPAAVTLAVLLAWFARAVAVDVDGYNPVPGSLRVGWLELLLIAISVSAAWFAAAFTLLAVGHREKARALAGFVRDCVVLLRRLFADPRVARRQKALLIALVGYLAMPIDLIPDIIPILGQLDEAILVALVLRLVVRSGGDDLVRQHWPGPNGSLKLVLRLAT